MQNISVFGATIHDSRSIPPAAGLVRCLRGVSTLTCVLGVFLAGIGAWIWWNEARQPSVGSWLTIWPPTRSVGRSGLPASTPPSFKITNGHFSCPVRVIGASGSCSEQGCVRVRSTLPLTIPPRGVVDLEIDYESRGFGQSKQIITIFTDCPGQGEIPLVVTADVIAPVPPEVQHQHR